MNTQQDMALLDQFATAALTGLLASESNPDDSVIGASYISYTNNEAAARAYAIADAMLEERQRRMQDRWTEIRKAIKEEEQEEVATTTYYQEYQAAARVAKLGNVQPLLSETE